MGEKNEVKVRFSTVVYLFIILVLVVALGAVYYLGFVKNDKANNMIASGELTENNNENVANIKDSEKDLPKNKEVNEVVTKFLEMLYARENGFESVLEKIGYDNPQEIYNNTVKSDNEGDTIYGIYNKNMDKYVGGYSNTKIKYSDFEEKISNYMTPGIVEQCFGGKFVEYNGFLYAFIGNASGAGVSNVTVQSIYNNIYLVKYSVSDEGGTDEYECIIRITNYNNKNVVSGFMG